MAIQFKKKNYRIAILVGAQSNMATVENPSYKQRWAYHATLLGGLCCILSILLILGNLGTQKEIAMHIEAERAATLASVLPKNLYNNNPLTDTLELEKQSIFASNLVIYRVTKDGVYNGSALQSSVAGWGGDIEFIVAINNAGQITGVRVIGHTETPGLADKIEVAKDDWILQFDGKSLTNTHDSYWAVKKDGGEIDQFTGATITPRAVVNAIHGSLKVLANQRQLDRAKSTPPITEAIAVEE